MSNLWAEFEKLIESKSRWIGTVSAVDTATGRITVSVPNSSEIAVVYGPGSYTVGESVIVEGDSIIGSAPPLRSIVDETIY